MVSKWLLHVCRKENGQRNQNPKGDKHANTCIAVQNGKATQWGVKCIHTVRAQMNLYPLTNLRYTCITCTKYTMNVYTAIHSHTQYIYKMQVLCMLIIQYSRSIWCIYIYIYIWCTVQYTYCTVYVYSAYSVDDGMYYVHIGFMPAVTHHAPVPV